MILGGSLGVLGILRLCGDLRGSWRVLGGSFCRKVSVGGLQLFSWAVRAGLRALLVVHRLSLHILCHTPVHIELSSRPMALESLLNKFS